MPDFIEPLRRAFGFKLIPLDCGDGGLTFVHFCRFATANTDTALQIQSAYAAETGRSLEGVADLEQTAHFIDWLIRTQWGEENASAQIH